MKSYRTTDDGRQVMAKAHIAFWQGELKKKEKKKLTIKGYGSAAIFIEDMP